MKLDELGKFTTLKMIHSSIIVWKSISFPLKHLAFNIREKLYKNNEY